MLEVVRTSARIIVLVGRNFTVATNEKVKIFISNEDGVRVRLCLCVCVYGLVPSMCVCVSGGNKMKENTKCETNPFYRVSSSFATAALRRCKNTVERCGGYVSLHDASKPCAPTFAHWKRSSMTRR